MDERYAIGEEHICFLHVRVLRRGWVAALLGADPAVAVAEFVDALPVSERGTVELSAADLRESARRIASQLTALRTRVARQLDVRGVTDAITGVREPELIMDRLVVEARRLLSADLAYIATGDSDVRFTIQHCDGVALTNLVGTSFAPRTGLAGRSRPHRGGRCRCGTMRRAHCSPMERPTRSPARRAWSACSRSHWFCAPVLAECSVSSTGRRPSSRRPTSSSARSSPTTPRAAWRLRRCSSSMPTGSSG